MATVGGAILLVFVGLGLWSAFAPDPFGASAHGCVNITVAGSTGGATLHYCGDAARAFCKSATAEHNQLAALARPQCRQAGLPVASGSPSTSP